MKPTIRLISLIAIIFIPRLIQLDRFLTPDEPLFLEQARQFSQFLHTGDTTQTLGIGYPGVTLAWWTTLALELTGTQNAPGLTPYVVGRFANGLLTGLLLLGMYALSNRLLGCNPAWLGVTMLALDPFTLGYSRLFHLEIPLTLLMTLSGLAYLLWLHEPRPRWLLLTGILSGLALLTKSTAILLIPMLLAMLITHLWYNYHTSLPSTVYRLPSTAYSLLLSTFYLLLISILTFTLPWPAMWTQPLTALDLTFGKLITDQAAGAGNLGMFWLGQFVEDPGPFFYPVAFLLKATPWLLLGLILSIWQLKNLIPRRDRVCSVSTPHSLPMWLFTLTYLLIMTLASKKAVRYLLPAIPMLYLLTALSITNYELKIKNYLSPLTSHFSFLTPYFLLLISHFLFLIPYSPYYLTYYNPLLIGWQWSPSTLLIGWGEGLDQAADYLNKQPRHGPVAAWYDNLFHEMYHGEVIPLVPPDNVMTAAHTVFYLNQVQRNIPDPNLVAYFQTRRQPEHIVRLNGIDYAWVYPAIAQFDHPPAPQYPLTGEFGGEARLLGYDIKPVRSNLIITLYWQALTTPPADRFIYVRLVDEAAHIWAKSDSPPVMGFWPTSRWQPAMFIEDAHALTISPETPPATYRLEVGLYDSTNGQPLPATGQPLGAGGGLLLGPITIGSAP